MFNVHVSINYKKLEIRSRRFTLSYINFRQCVGDMRGDFLGT